MSCPACRTKNLHFYTLDKEIWVFEWCYHDDPVQENVKHLAAIFFALGRVGVATA